MSVYFYFPTRPNAFISYVYVQSAVLLILEKVTFAIVSTIRGKSRTGEEREQAVDNCAITDGYKSRYIVTSSAALEERLLLFNIQNTAF